MNALVAAPAAAPVPFPRILCAVDGGRESKVAVHHAIALARPGAAVRFLAVSDLRDEGRAREALRAAALLARRAGVEATTELAQAAEPRRALLAAARAHDVIVLGTRRRSRAEGIALGGTAALALHACDRPVLVARPTPDWRALGEHVLIASDGTPGSRRAAEIAGAIAARAGGVATLLHVGEPGPTEAHRELALEALDLDFMTRSTPALRIVSGRTADAISDAAREHRATLVVLGSRGLAGIRALASVSERVGATAPCPVLVLRPSRQAS